MCAGRCREPRCIRSPGRGSQRLRRALGGTRILLAAAPTTPPCFCRWQRSSLLHRGFPPPDYSAGRCCSNPPLQPLFKADKTETPVPGSDTGVLGGRGWITRAALLKTAHWAVFTLSSATAPQLFESTRPMSLALLQNKNLSALAYVEAFWWSEATQIRTIALWGIFGGDFIESDGFCAVFVVEFN